MRRHVELGLALMVAAGCIACGDVNTALTHLTEARAKAADVLVQFTAAADASNRAVMADTDRQSVEFADEARRAKQAVHQDVSSLKPLLTELHYADETKQLDEFTTRFAEYDALDRQILDLAVENTNLKAQQLSFGAAQAADDEFARALDSTVATVPAESGWPAKAHAAAALAALREIHVLEAPHIAEARDDAMTNLETRMSAASDTARRELDALAAAAPAGAAHVADARRALDSFIAVHAQIIALSRQNTNVRSLALSLDEKRKLVEPCSASLRALIASLQQRGFRVGHGG